MDGIYEPSKVLRDLDVNSSPSKSKIQNGKGEDSPSDEYSDNEIINDQIHNIKFEIEGLGSLDDPSPSSGSEAQTENLAVIDDSCSNESQLDYSGEEHDLDHMIGESISTVPFSISPGARQDSPLNSDNLATNEAEHESMPDQDDEDSTSTDIDEEDMDLDSDNVLLTLRGRNSDAAIEGTDDDDTAPNKNINETPRQLSAFTFYHIPSPVSAQDRDMSHDIDSILMPPPPPRQIRTIVSSKKKRKRGRRRSDAVDLSLSYRDSDDRPVVKLSKHLENTYNHIRSNALNVPVQQLYQENICESDSEIHDLQNSRIAQDFSNTNGGKPCNDDSEARSDHHNEEHQHRIEVALTQDKECLTSEEAYEYSTTTFESGGQSMDSKRVVSQSSSSDEDEDINMNVNEKSSETCKIARHDNENCNENADQVDDEEIQSENDANSCEVNSEVEFDKPSITARFSDIIGHGAAKLRLDEMLLPLALPPTISRNVLVGIRAVPASILFYGPPGTGKTQLAKAVAGEARAAFISIGPSDVLSKFVGESEASIKKLFEEAKQKALRMESRCAILFFDEIDALGMSRGNGDGNNGGEDSSAGNSSRRILAELLIQLTQLSHDEKNNYSCEEKKDASELVDDCTVYGSRLQEQQTLKPRVVVIAATNRPDDCDPALLRRFAIRVHVGLPSKRDRRKIITKLLNGIENTLTTSQLMELAEMTDGWSGSDLESVSREAVMAPIRECLRAAAVLKMKARKQMVDQHHNTDNLADDDLAREELLNRFGNLRPVTKDDFDDAIHFWAGNSQEHIVACDQNRFDSCHYDSDSTYGDDG